MTKHLRIHLTEDQQTLADFTFMTTLDLPRILELIQPFVQSPTPAHISGMSEQDAIAIKTVGKKYTPLAEHLARVQGDTVTLAFEEIESILRSALPPTSRSTHAKAWWASTDTHSQGKAWLALGWQTSVVDAEGERIEFRRR